MPLRPRLPNPKSGIKSVEEATIKATAKASAKNAGGISGTVVVLASAIPVIGATIATIWVAESSQDVIDELLNHPEALAVLGGLAVLVLIK